MAAISFNVINFPFFDCNLKVIHYQFCFTKSILLDTFSKQHLSPNFT